MTFLKIDPISTQSIGGYPVVIDGLDPSDHDCIVGEISLPIGKKRARWNLTGIMRGGVHECNLPMKADDLDGLEALAKKLGAT